MNLDLIPLGWAFDRQPRRYPRDRPANEVEPTRPLGS
jgi:hypothetical protein